MAWKLNIFLNTSLSGTWLYVKRNHTHSTVSQEKGAIQSACCSDCQTCHHAGNGDCKCESSAKYLLFFKSMHWSEMLWWEKKKKKKRKVKKKKRKEKMGIVNFFVLGMFQWIGCRSWISAEFLVPLLDAGFAKWSKCGLGYEYPSCV